MCPSGSCEQLWGAVWPEDRDALGDALAVIGAFAPLLGEVAIAVSGDLDAALAELLDDLTAEGLCADDLPRVQLIPAPDDTQLTPVALLPAALAAACEYHRRPWQPVFDRDDTAHRAVWTTAAQILSGDPEASVTVLAETLEGSRSLPAHRVRIVSTSPALRRQATRAGITAVPRPPAARHLPPADCVIADARRPDDLALIAEADTEIRLVNDQGLAARALAAFGLDPRPASVHAGG